MSPYGIDGLEKSCLRPGNWLVENHPVRRLQIARGVQGLHGGARWVIIHAWTEAPINDETYPTFRDALGSLYDHLGERGCDCKPPEGPVSH